jgi:hypothetical protein
MVTPIVSKKHRSMYQFFYVKIVSTNYTKNVARTTVG